MSRESFQRNTETAAVLEMERWGARPIILELDIITTLAICGALQLSLRHPQFATRPSAKNIREFVMAIEKQIPPEFPTLHKIIQLGFNPRFDK